MLLRSRNECELTVSGQKVVVEVLEVPFREGVELRCRVFGREFRVSDRGLGEHEALRILEEEILSYSND